MPPNLRIKAILSVLGEKIKMDVEDNIYRVYVADCLKSIAENTAVPACYYTQGERGTIINSRYSEIISPNRNEKILQKGVATSNIREKLR